MSPRSHSLVPQLRGWCFLLVVVAAGCQRTANSLPLNEVQARDACTEFLTAWKDGKKADDLKPRIIGRDADWVAGKKLETFEILPQEQRHGPNLHIFVRRTLKDEKGRTLKQDVSFIVGTSPVITVFRNDEA